MRGGDVEEGELVGPLGVVARGDLDRIAGVAQPDEVDALDDAAVLDVEAGDDALRQHADLRPPRPGRPRNAVAEIDGAGVERPSDDHAR